MSEQARSAYGLVLDLQASQTEGSAERGLGRYVIELTRALLAYPGLVRAIALNPTLSFPGHLPGELLASGLLTWNTATAFRHAQRQGPVAYCVMSPFEHIPTAETITPPHTVRPDVPLLAIVHDLIPLAYAKRYLDPYPEFARRYRRRLDLVRTADLVLTNSDHTRREVIELLDLPPDRVVTIGGGAADYFQPPDPGSDPLSIVRHALPAVRRPYVLSVLGSDDRKNGDGLLSAWARLPRALRQQYQLVLACHLIPSYAERWKGHARACGLTDDEVVWTGHVSDRLLRALYQAARLFVFASLVEGYGLPAAEAIACDCPTITSDTTSLPEVLAWEPATFDPRDPDSIAAAIARALTDTAFYQELRAIARQRAPLHRWSAVAARAVGALARLPAPPTPSLASLNGARGADDAAARSIQGEPSRIGAWSRQRLALVGPLPPSSSGLAAHNVRLAQALAQRCTLDLFATAGGGRTLSSTLDGVRCFPARALGRPLNPAAYDAIVYTVDNRDDHHDTYELARQYPGLVWLHDLHLDAFYRSYGQARRGGDAHGFVHARLDELYGERVPNYVPRPFRPEQHVRHGLRLTQEWVRTARAVLVNTRVAQHLVALDQGPHAAHPPLWRMPLACPPPSGVARGWGEGRAQPPVVAVFGQVHHAKLPEPLMDALLLVRARVPARLVFVGPIVPAMRAAYEEQAALRGLSAAVTFTGAVSPEEYAAWLARATCAAQLRVSNDIGGTAAIADCLAAGLPVVTNLVDAAREYGDAVVALPSVFATEALAAQLVALLTEPATWERRSAAALAFAEAHSFATLADALLRAVAAVQEVDCTAWTP
ncbi:MAG: glycosyltransferase [Chloroflexi bacterium]|nr:glycosyltransferase [Chloroflexota bacterium]